MVIAEQSHSSPLAGNSAIGYKLNDFELDTSWVCLRKGPQVIDVQPTSFRVLTYLVENRERVVPRQELIDAVWRDAAIAYSPAAQDEALTQCVFELSRAFEDDAVNPRYLKTVQQYGYGYVGPVEPVLQPVDASLPTPRQAIAQATYYRPGLSHWPWVQIASGIAAVALAVFWFWTVSPHP